MKDDRKLAARMTAEHLSALEQELDTARNCADPDWDQIEALSREAAAMFVTEDDAEAGKQALLAALSAEQKPRIRTFRWGHFAAAAAVAGIAAIAVPAALKQKNAIQRIPEPAVSETTVTEVTGTAVSAEPVTETKTTSARKTTETTAVQTASTAEQTDTAPGTSSQTTVTQITTASASAEKTEKTEKTAKTVKTTAAATENTRTTASQTESSVSVTSSAAAETVTVTEPTDAPDTKPVQNTDIPGDQTHEWYYTDYTGYIDWPSYTATCITNGYDHTDWNYTQTDMTGTAPPEWSVFIYRFLDETTHEPVQGAQLQIFDITGSLILEFQTDGSSVMLNLKPGDSYRLHAVSVPEGYLLPARDQIIKAEYGTHEIYLRHE